MSIIIIMILHNLYCYIKQHYIEPKKDLTMRDTLHNYIQDLKSSNDEAVSSSLTADLNLLNKE